MAVVGACVAFNDPTILTKLVTLTLYCSKKGIMGRKFCIFLATHYWVWVSMAVRCCWCFHPQRSKGLPILSGRVNYIAYNHCFIFHFCAIILDGHQCKPHGVLIFSYPKTCFILTAHITIQPPHHEKIHACIIAINHITYRRNGF